MSDTAPSALTAPRGPIDVALDLNEGAHPSMKLLDCLAALGSSLLRRYPDTRDLVNLLSQRLGVPAGLILPTAGANDALNRACRAFVRPGQEVILPLPTYDPLERFVYQANAKVVPIEWMEGPFPVDTVLKAVTPNTTFIAVVSPQNPTGAVISPDELEKLARGAPRAGLVVDMAYAEFAEVDLTPTVMKLLPNAVMVRTLSKAWGLAGLRVGYAIGAPDQLGAMSLAGMPYPVSGPSAAIAERALATTADEVEAYVARVRQERRDLETLLAPLGVKVYPSQGNFIFARFHRARWVWEALGGLGIAVRSYLGRPGLSKCLRITCSGHQPWSERLRHGLHAALRPQAVLFATEPFPVEGLATARLESLDGIPAALQNLGVERAWLVGDTPEAMRSARDAGVVPIGLLPAAARTAAEALLVAGASRVMVSSSELETLLPARVP